VILFIFGLIWDFIALKFRIKKRGNKMGQLLSVHFHRSERIVSIKIKYQHESLRKKMNTDITREIIRNESYAICSAHGPRIYHNSLYIKGSCKDFDDDVCRYKFQSIREAKNWCENIAKLVCKINTNLEDYNLKNIKIKDEYKSMNNFKKVIFNEPATIIIWDDNSKTIVKCKDGEVFDKEKGFLMAYFQKHSNKTKTQTSKFFDRL
jgi:hypothetical protein